MHRRQNKLLSIPSINNRHKLKSYNENHFIEKYILLFIETLQSNFALHHCTPQHTDIPIVAVGFHVPPLDR